MEAVKSPRWLTILKERFSFICFSRNSFKNKTNGIASGLHACCISRRARVWILSMGVCHPVLRGGAQGHAAVVVLGSGRRQLGGCFSLQSYQLMSGPTGQRQCERRLKPSTYLDFSCSHLCAYDLKMPIQMSQPDVILSVDILYFKDTQSYLGQVRLH